LLTQRLERIAVNNCCIKLKMSDPISYLLAFFSTVVLVGILTPLAHRVGLIDKPNARKKHETDTPLVGGLAIYFAIIISFLTLGHKFSDFASFFIPSMLIVSVCLWDDLRELTYTIRLASQVIAIILMCLLGNMIENIGILTIDGSYLYLGMLAAPFTIFFSVGLINSFNMCDGIDGLLGALALIALAGFSIASINAGHTEELQFTLILMSAIIAFLVFNFRTPWRKRGLVFLGDVGSMLIGFALLWLAIRLTQGENRVLSPIAAMWFFAFPLFDSLGIIIRRIVRGRSPFTPDREHFHHVLLLAGFSVNQSVAIIILLATLGAAFGLMGEALGVHEMVMLFLFASLFGLYYWGMMRAWKFMRFLNRSICRRAGLDRRMHHDRRKTVSANWADSNLERRSFSGDRRSNGRRQPAQHESSNMQNSVTLNQKDPCSPKVANKLIK